ncbi:hypothetical protein CMO88_04355 [Candidatus Woesearchaeota archaeon]|nr:hypothetical protein [Candidatus Woesearchaeota archaeon]
MNKIIIYAVLFIILAQSVFAATVKVDKWMYSGQSITVEGRTFIMYKSVTNQDVIADYGEGSLFITNNSCQQTGKVRICLDNIEYYYDALDYRMEIRALSLIPDLTVTRTAVHTEVEAGEGTTFNVEIENIGGLAQNLTYTDVFPENVEILRVNGVVKKDNGIVWKKRTMGVESESFSYNIKVNDIIDRSFIGKLEYWDGEDMKTIWTDALSLKTTHKLLHKFVLGADTGIIGGKNNISLNFTNKEIITANVKADVYIDDGIEITKAPKEFKKVDERHYTADLAITKYPGNRSMNITQGYFFEFKGTKVGTFDIKATVKYSTKNYPERELSDLKESIEFTDKSLKVRSNFEDLELEANQAKTLRIWLQNLHPKLSIKNVFVSLNGGGIVTLPDIFVKRFAPHEQKKLVEIDFYAPNITSNKGYTIEANVSYHTEYDENFTKKFKFTTTISPAKDMTITQTIDAPSLESGEETTVTVSVKNPRKTKIKNIVVEDTVPENFTVIGNFRHILTLESEGEQKAYTYVIKAPRVNKKTTYILNTTITYTEENAAQQFDNPREYKITKSGTITVNPQDFELTATRTIGADIYLGDRFEVEYKLKNPSTDIKAENIQLTIPIHSEFDLVGNEKTINAGSLQPGEEITIISKEKRRAKKAGSYKLGKTKVTYSNQFGEEFEVNVTEKTVKVSDKTNEETFIFVTKSTIEKANNTDYFDVTLSLASKGKSLITVLVEDEDFKKEIAMRNGSTFNITYKKRIDSPGKYSLQQATAYYEDEGVSYLTASSNPEIEIVDNPVITFQKIVPEAANSFEKFDVELKTKPLAKGITNLTITDEETLHYGTLEEEIIHKYQKTFKNSGEKELEAATVTYTYKNEIYELTSGSPTITIVEKALLSIYKNVSVNESKPGKKIEVTIKLTNNANDELDILLEDGSKNWDITLGPGEEKTVKHKVKASQIEAATAKYTYDQEEKSTRSNTPEFTLLENGKILKEKNIVRRIADMLVSIITWQRG